MSYSYSSSYRKSGSSLCTSLNRGGEDEVLANAGVDVFEELFKLIFAKLYDEWYSGQGNRRRTRLLEFRNTGQTEAATEILVDGLLTLGLLKGEPQVLVEEKKIQRVLSPRWFTSNGIRNSPGNKPMGK